MLWSCTAWKTSEISSGGHHDDTQGISRSSIESIVIEILELSQDTKGTRKGRTARNFRPSGFDDQGETAPQALVIPRLKASFNIYDLFRFNSTCKREAYLYSTTVWLAGWLTRSLRDVLIPRDFGFWLEAQSFTLTRQERKMFSSSSNLNALRIFVASRALLLIYSVYCVRTPYKTETEEQRIN